MCLCQRGAFTDFQRIFSFCCSFEPEAESRMRPLAHEWHKPSPTAGKPGRMIYQPDQTGLAKQINHTSLRVVCPVSRFRQCSLFILGFSFFTDFSLKSFPNLPLLPFTSIFAPFSTPHQVVIFVLGAKVIPGSDGNARSSLLFSGKISSPAGSIFPKNLAFPNPYLFLSTRNENDRCDRKTH